MERLFLSNPLIRRNFLDKLIYGVDRDYWTTLNKYQKKILERTKILKQQIYDQGWLEQVEIEIVNLGMNIFQKRIQHLNTLNSILSLLNQPVVKFYQIKLQTLNNFILDFLTRLENLLYVTNLRRPCLISLDLINFKFFVSLNIEFFIHI